MSGCLSNPLCNQCDTYFTHQHAVIADVFWVELLRRRVLGVSRGGYETLNKIFS